MHIHIAPQLQEETVADKLPDVHFYVAWIFLRSPFLHKHLSDVVRIHAMLQRPGCQSPAHGPTSRTSRSMSKRVSIGRSFQLEERKAKLLDDCNTLQRFVVHVGALAELLNLYLLMKLKLRNLRMTKIFKVA